MGINDSMNFQDKNLICLSELIYWDKQSSLLYENCRPIYLSNAETMILEFLINNINRKINAFDLFDYLWGDSKEYNSKSIRNLICKLRKKLPKNTIQNCYGSEYFIASYLKKNIINPHLMEEIDILSMVDFPNLLDQLNYSIVITDPNQYDNPIIYANKNFYDFFGYEKNEVIGSNCRFLRRNDNNQPVIQELRNAIISQTPITAIVRNYTKNEQLVYNEVSISPIFNKLTHKLEYFLGIQRNITTDIDKFLNIRYME